MRRLSTAILPVLALAIMPIMSASAAPTLECTGSSQVEIGDCLAEVEDRAEAAVQAALGFARDAAVELDSVTERTEVVPALEASQAAWESFRDSQCNYVGTTFGGGSGTGIAVLACRIMIARMRTDALLDSLD